MLKIKLFLFDLDGTLVSTGGAGLRALNLTFEKMFGVKSVTERVNPSGKTDPAIFREAIQLFLNRDMTSADLSLISNSYLRYLSIEVRYSKNYRILTGVEVFLDHLMTRGDIMLGLGTGNLEAGARIKLLKSNLNPYFPFGGFGSDAELRSHVLKRGHERASQRCGQEISPENVFVIGDTPLDVAAARQNGYQSVAVGQEGVVSPELEKSLPDFLLGDMREGFSFLKELETAPRGVIS